MINNISKLKENRFIKSVFLLLCVFVYSNSIGQQSIDNSTQNRDNLHKNPEHLQTLIFKSNANGSLKSSSRNEKLDFLSDMAVNLGYQYLGKGLNSAYLGADLRLSDRNNTTTNIGLGMYATGIGNRLELVPSAHFNLAQNAYMLEISSSNWFFKPSIGINLLNFIQLKLGYSFWYSQKQYNSISLGINFCLGSSHFYDTLKVIY